MHNKKFWISFLAALLFANLLNLCNWGTPQPIEVTLNKKSKDPIKERGVHRNSTIIDLHEAVRRGLATYDKVMTNYYNYQYYSTLYVGAHDYEMTFIYDTGSDYLWIPLNNCSNWGGTKYTPSSTFTTNGTRDGIYYLDGSGYEGMLWTHFNFKQVLLPKIKSVQSVEEQISLWVRKD